jgi:hypothetical protein
MRPHFARCPRRPVTSRFWHCECYRDVTLSYTVPDTSTTLLLGIRKAQRKGGNEIFGLIAVDQTKL